MTRSVERIFSFEFFPPATPEGVAKLRATREQLAQLRPRFFSVTFGAGGSTRDRTLAAVVEIQASGQRAAPHISCIGSTRESIRTTLATYRQHGIGHLGCRGHFLLGRTAGQSGKGLEPRGGTLSIGRAHARENQL